MTVGISPTSRVRRDEAKAKQRRAMSLGVGSSTREVQTQIDGGNTKQKIMNAMQGAEKKCGAGGF